MNLYIFTYFVIFIWIKTIYSQIGVNFRILGKNENNWAKGEYTKIKKGRLEYTSTHQSCPNAQKSHVTTTKSPLKPMKIRLNKGLEANPIVKD